MYAIEINLLRERTGPAKEEFLRSGSTVSDNIPLFIGGGVGVAAIGLVLLGSAAVTFQNQRLVAREQQLDDELARIAPQLAQLDKLKAEEQQVKTETQALTTIFNQIKPWSATLQDVSDRVPTHLQISKIEQSASAAPAPASPPPQGGNPPPPAAPVASELTITGKARSFDDINDFVLALKTSPFLSSDSTKLVQSQRPDTAPANAEDKLALVDYKITTAINGVAASDLLQELQQKGAAGLVARIDFLKQKGVIQK
uniref:Fimbrial assembly family protein n=1 Tax=Cyanothece sp. (strain PCC 7425 / ATCC 29141) TaxID=395961 RepID=B8HRE4_CYAP4